MYATGDMTEAYSADRDTATVAMIARWDGSQRPASGAGIAGPILTVGNAMMAVAERQSVGGHVSSAGGVDASNVAAWDESSETWSAVRVGVDDIVRTLAYDADSGVLHAGGDYHLAGQDLVDHMAAWGGSLWSSVGGGLIHPVFSFSMSESGLSAGGGSGGATLA